MFTGSKVKTRFRSLRTDFVRLKRELKLLKSKSGVGAKKLTALQRWKLQRFNFLSAHCRPTKLPEELGRVSIISEFSRKYMKLSNYEK